MKSEAFKTTTRVDFNARQDKDMRLWLSSGFLFDTSPFLHFSLFSYLPGCMQNVGSEGSGTAYDDNSLEEHGELKRRNG